ncbi:MULTISPECIES: hypothetical protein [unclassified Mesorhizobium]|uniref:hypothetical protein n=1 Tax=unclassified Mesorhizobium TaxID=325217 RepID=UPI000FCC50D2|nr:MULTISPECIES: hypothetical protein [unclassified Mesorhizobium]RUT87640.1 hypothetical protein EOD14_09585 [Mesorhizobium sp. M7A.T.Ca.US.000.02.1.1]RUT87821.1 hypothetical protein EOD15_22985 [Mesorhizobium sp. M7A.T.Ca.US.000.02.2.1]
MAKEKNPDKVRVSTPRVTLKYPKLDRVDYGSEKYPDKDGSYNTRFIADRADPKVSAMLAKIDAVMVRAKELAEEKFSKMDIKARKKIEAKTGGIVADEPYSTVYDDDTEEDTGKIDMKVKMKAKGVYGPRHPRKGETWTAKPDIFDGKGKPMKKGLQIWGGSVAIINFDLEPYFVDGSGSYGVSRRLNAVQIIELVSGGQRAASSYGFEAEEDGFDANDVETEEDEDNDDSGSDGSPDDDDTDF